MDFCDICLDPPRPLEGRITGAVRLDAVEGNRRLPGRSSPSGEPVRAPLRGGGCPGAAVGGRRTDGPGGDGLQPLLAAPERGRGSRRRGRAGSVRLNGLPEPEADPAAGVVLPGLGAGCAAALTWEVEDGGEREPVRVRYQYLFAGETLTGEAAPA